MMKTMKQSILVSEWGLFTPNSQLNERLFAYFRPHYMDGKASFFAPSHSPYSNNNDASFIEYSYGKYHPVGFPIDKYGEPGDLCQAVIRRFSRSCLCQIRDGRSGRSGTSGQARPLEAVFQDEFYRAYWHEVPGGGIASECVVGGDGRVDFFVMSPGWGIELVRDSDRLVEHLERFKKNGAYYTDIMSGTMKDWIVLDFRHSFPKKKCNSPSLSKEYGERPGLIFWNRPERATAVEGRF